MKDHVLSILIFLFFITTNTFSQTKKAPLSFDVKYYDAVDKWVAFPKKESDTSYALGFIYIDKQAGFTFDYLTTFSITEDGLKKGPNIPNASMKSRLSPNTREVAVLNEEQITELELPAVPDWLDIYKNGSNTTDYLKQMGYHYNHVGASHLALEPLLKAYEKEPHYEGLEFELSFAYNALGQFENAISVLEEAIKNNPNNYYFYRELGFSYVNQNKIDEAESTYKKGISISDNDFEKSEMAVNMAQAYFKLKNREKFDEWAQITRQYAEKGSRYTQFIDLFEQKWDEE